MYYRQHLSQGVHGTNGKKQEQNRKKKNAKSKQIGCACPGEQGGEVVLDGGQKGSRRVLQRNIKRLVHRKLHIDGNATFSTHRAMLAGRCKKMIR